MFALEWCDKPAEYGEADGPDDRQYIDVDDAVV